MNLELCSCLMCSLHRQNQELRRENARLQSAVDVLQTHIAEQEVKHTAPPTMTQTTEIFGAALPSEEPLFKTDEEFVFVRDLFPPDTFGAYGSYKVRVEYWRSPPQVREDETITMIKTR